MITHLEPDILECEGKWALGSITVNKVSGGDGIPVELFQILKDDAMKVLHSICQQTWKSQQWSQDGERSVFILVTKKGTIKDRNGMDLSEKEDITKRWQYKKSELYKKDLHDPDNQNDVIIHIQADILDCEVKWAFSSVQFSHSVVFDSLQPHETQHARPPCPSPTPRVHSDSHPSSQ